MSRAALDGIRVLDLGMITAGAATSQILADFGADVIKVESPTRPDIFRNWTQVARSASGEVDLNESPPFRAVNRNKRDIAIDLKSAAGLAIFLRLVAISDVVIENFRRGVLERLGIDFESLLAVNEKIVLVSLSSQGPDGPESHYGSFGSSLEASGGLMSITGFTTPTWTGANMNYPDQTISIAAPGMVIAGLMQRDRTGKGVHVEVPQREVMTSLLGELLLDASVTGRVAGLRGNRDPDFAPQGVYATQGADRWMAISVKTDDDWSALVEILGLSFDTEWDLQRRIEEHDVIDSVISQRVRNRSSAELAHQLQGRGIAAAEVLRPDEVAQQEQLTAVGGVTSLPDDQHTHRGFLARFSATPGSNRRRAPRLGEHTTEILSDLLGLAPAQIANLEESKVIFTDGKASKPTQPTTPDFVEA